MKNIIVTIGIFLFTFNVASAQWVQIPSGTTSQLHSVHFPNPATGYAAGRGVVLKTLDTGKTWNPVLNANVLFQEIFFFNSDTGITYTSGRINNSKLYRTFDGGVNWIVDSIGNLKEILNFVYINDTIKLLGKTNTKTQLYESYDYSDTWILINDSVGKTSFFADMAFVNTEIGYIHTPYSPLLKTTDGGVSWSQRNILELSEISGGLFFYSPDTGFVGGGYAPMLAKTIDGGQSWQPIMKDSNGTMLSSKFISVYNNTLFAGGNRCILYSSDSGVTWIKQVPNILNMTLSDMYVIDEDNAVAVGNGGLIIRTTNSGGTVGIKGNGYLKKKIKVYPNPAQEIITLEIERDVEINKIELMDMQGKVVKSYSQNERQLNVGRVANGNYLLQIYTNKGSVTQKVMIE